MVVKSPSLTASLLDVKCKVTFWLIVFKSNPKSSSLSYYDSGIHNPIGIQHLFDPPDKLIIRRVKFSDKNG